MRSLIWISNGSSQIFFQKIKVRFFTTVTTADLDNIFDKYNSFETDIRKKV